MNGCILGTMPFYQFRLLNMSTAQLVIILPLTALLEFVDDAKKLHVFKLCGITSSWNWPLTPKDARLLLSADNIANACCPDRPGAAPTLSCMDGNYGGNLGKVYGNELPMTSRNRSKK